MSKPKFKWWKAFKKGILPAVGAYAATQVANYNLGDVLTNPQEQLPNIGTAILVGLLPAVINTWKNRDKPGNPFYVPPSYLGCMMALASLAGLLAGCITTQHPDGTVTQQVDVSTAWAIYEAVQAERARIEAERDAADAADRARLEMQIRALSEAAERAYDRWLDAGGRLPTVTVE